MHAEALLRHAVLTEDYNEKVAIRTEARRKANEASCWQSAADSSIGDVERMLATLK